MTNLLPTVLAPEILAGVISAKMFHHGNISTFAHFGAVDFPADGCFNTWTFRHGNFLAWGISCSKNFQHRNISAWGNFGILYNYEINYTFLKHFLPVISFEFLNFLIQIVADNQRNFSRIFQGWIIPFRKADKLIVSLKQNSIRVHTLPDNLRQRRNLVQMI